MSDDYTRLQRIIIDPTQLQDQTLILTPDQQHYLQRVLRLLPGDAVIAMDGQGHQWQVELADNLTTAKILNPITTHTELPLPITLQIALPKGNGFDEVIRQTTELGVHRIVPVISDRTLLNPSPKKLERWHRIAREAAEQSERTHLPDILPPLSFQDALQQSKQAACYLAVARGSAPHLLHHLSQRLSEHLSGGLATQPISEILIATGPEGGWTDGEIEQATQMGYQPVSLGARILRAVTAPLTVMSIVAAAIEAPLISHPPTPKK